MITGIIGSMKQYESLHPLFAEAFSFLAELRRKPFSAGKIKYHKDKIFAILSEYDTKPPEQSPIESHLRYIDIQYIYAGEERIGWQDISRLKKIGEDTDKDFIFYSGKIDYLNAVPGSFFIFSPEDAHKPGVRKKNPGKVKKIVIKVAL